MYDDDKKRRLQVYQTQIGRPVPQPAQKPRLQVTSGSLPNQQPQRFNTPAPKQSFGMRIRDIFDANTEADKWRRQSEGRLADFTESEKARGVNRPDQNIAQAFFRGPAQLFNTAEAARKQAIETGRGQLAMMTGNQKALQMSLERQRKQRQAEFQGNTGLLGVGTIFENPEESMNLGAAEIAKRVGAVTAETGSFAVGGGALKKPVMGLAAPVGTKVLGLGTKQGLKQLGKFMATESAAGAVGAGAGTRVRNPNATGQEIATNAAFGAILAPPLAFGVSAAGRRIGTFFRTKQGTKIAQELAEEANPVNIKKVLEEAEPNISSARSEQLSQDIARATTPDQVVRAIERSAGVESVSDDVVRSLTGVRKPEQVAPAIRALFPDLDDTQINAVSKQLADAKSEKAVREVLEQVQARRAAVTEAVEQATPEAPQPSPRAQELAQAIDQPVGPTRITDAPTQATEAPTPQAKGVADAVDAQQVPETTRATEVPRTPDQISADLEAQRLAQEQRLITPNKARELESQLNPLAKAERIDRAMGRAGDSLLDADKSLANALDVSRYTNDIATQKLERAGIQDIVGRYSGVAEDDFNTYLNIRFARESLEKNGKQIMPLSKQEMDSWITNYEASNPRATQDAQTVKAWSDSLIDDAVQGGVIEKEFGDFIKSYYKDYAPLERILPENLESMVDMRSGVGSIGRQRIIQQLEGSDIPLSTKFDRFTKRAGIVESQLSNARISRLLRDSMDAGVIAGRDVFTAADSKMIKEYKSIAQALSKDLKSATGKARTARAKLGRSTLDKNMAQKDAITRARTELRKIVNDPDAEAAIGSLSKDDLLAVFDTMANDAPPSANTRAIFKKFANKSEQHQRIIDKIADTKARRDGIKNQLSEVKTNLSEISPDSTTGKVTISGFDDGFPFKFEIDDMEVVKMLKAVKPEKLDMITRTLAAVWRPFRMAFTGPLNPIFLARATILYDAPMTGIISPVKWRNRMNARAVAETFKSVSKRSDFQQLLREQGVQVYSASRTAIDPKLSTERLRANANLWNKIKRVSNPKNIAETIDRIDTFSGKLEGVHRSRQAVAAYDEAIKAGATPEAAAARARYVYANSGPNYGNTTQFLRQLDAIAPYSNAAVAGTRAFLAAGRRRPVRTAANAAAIFGVPAMGAVALSMKNNSDAYTAYIEDMEASRKQYNLDNNFIIALPGASKDEKTGEWQGIIKIAVPPEARGINKAIWRQAYDLIKGNGMTDPQVYAGAIFDTMTGQMSPIDPVTGEARPNINPAVNTVAGLMTNKDLSTGRDIVSQDMSNLDKKDQVYPWTGGVPRRISEATGGRFSPIQVQYFLNQLGSPVKAAQTYTEQQMHNRGSIPQEQVTDNSLISQAKRSFEGGYGMSQSRQRTEYVNDLKKDMTRRQRTDYDSYRATEFDEDSKPIYDPYRKYVKAELLQDNKVFEAVKKEAFLQNEQTGKPIDPIFNLPEADRRKVLQKRTLVPGAKDLELSKLWEKTWYQQYQNQVDRYFSDYEEWRKTQGYDERENTNPYPVAPDNVRAVQDEYNALPRGDGARGGNASVRKWIESNPDKYALLEEQWARQTAWTNNERKKLGLDPLPEDEYLAIRKTFDASSSGTGGGSGRGRGGGRGSKADETPRQYLSTYLAGVGKNIKPIPEIDTKVNRTKFRVKTPSGRGRNFRRIRLS